MWKFGPIHRGYLLVQLKARGVPIKSQKIALDFEGVFHSVPLYDSRLQSLGTATVKVVKSPFRPKGKSSQHRILVTCPTCQSFQPFGRMHQHVDSAICKTAKDKAVHANTRYGEREKF